MNHDSNTPVQQPADNVSATTTSSKADIKPHEHVDARGLNCPLPILRAKKALNEMLTGQVLEVIATDPGAVMDFEAFCKQSGNKLLHKSDNEGELRFLLEKV